MAAEAQTSEAPPRPKRTALKVGVAIGAVLFLSMYALV